MITHEQAQQLGREIEGHRVVLTEWFAAGTDTVILTLSSGKRLTVNASATAPGNLEIDLR